MYQKKKFDKYWQGFERSLIECEIKEGRLFKIVSEGEIACVFSVNYQVPLLWGEKNKDPAIYLHRIVTNEKFKGKGCVIIIADWVKKSTLTINKKYIRMDTFGDNKELVDYYIRCGFYFMGFLDIQNIEGLPIHYKGARLGLFEMIV